MNSKIEVNSLPTDDKRREVAANLRRLAKSSYSARYLVERYLGLIYDDNYFVGSVYTSESVSSLANLMEPQPERTCRMERVEWIDTFLSHEIKRHKFVCSSCGLELETDITSSLKYPYAYCPKCGAKVAD